MQLELLHIYIRMHFSGYFFILFTNTHIRTHTYINTDIHFKYIHINKMFLYFCISGYSMYVSMIY